MRIKYLQLIAFKRFPLRSVEMFEEEISSSIIMVTGPNGAGKSSLFNELTPLPTERSAFGKGGYKEIHIEHESVEYILICDFTEKPVFRFVRDGEELNVAGIVTTQRDLAIQYFGISPSTHDILTGTETFCDMSLLARKKLFSTITHMNIDAVLSGYNELKETHKTITLLHKSQLSNYKAEESKLMDKELLALRKSELEGFKTLTDNLLSMRYELQRYRDPAASDSVYVSLSSMVNLSRTFIEKNYTSLTAYPRKDIEKIREKKQTELHILEYKLDNYYKLLEAKARELMLLGESNLGNRAELQTRLVDVLNIVEKRKKDLKYITSIDEVTEDTYGAIYKLESSIPDIVANMLPNSGMDGERVYTRERYDDLLETKNDILKRLHQVNAEEISIRKDLERVNDATGNIDCPSCSHSWPLKDALSASVHREEELQRLAVVQKGLRGNLAVNERSIEELQEYFKQYNQLSTLRKATIDSLPFFWGAADKEDYLFLEPNKLVYLLSNVNNELISVSEIHKGNKEIEEIRKRLDDITATENVSIDSIKAEADELTYTTKELQSVKMALSKEIKDILRLSEAYVKLEGMERRLDKDRFSVQEHHLDHLAMSIIKEIDDKIREYRVSTVNIENELHQANTVQYTLNQYKKDIKESEEKLKVLSAILVELCPKSGLIAKSVSSFLNTIIHNVNNTIAKIWNYKMVLSPINVENDALNYRFKVEVEDNLVIDDISKVSKGMKEAINLSFKLVMYKLLKFDNYPLLLDELSSNMDTHHSETTLRLVSQLATGGRFSQVFLITHKENYSFLKDLSVIELG